MFTLNEYAYKTLDKIVYIVSNQQMKALTFKVSAFCNLGQPLYLLFCLIVLRTDIKKSILNHENA